VISAPAPTGLDKAAPLTRSDAMKETLAKGFPTPAKLTAAALRRKQTIVVVQANID
jgi:hypothetical protein